MLTDGLLRLAWALPLVLVVGVVAVLILKRLTTSTRSETDPVQRMRLRESLLLSVETRVHLIDVDGGPYLVVESSLQAAVHSAPPQTSQTAGVRPRFGSRWMQRLTKTGLR